MLTKRRKDITPELAEGAEAATFDFSGVDMTWHGNYSGYVEAQETPELNDWDYATSAVEWTDAAEHNGQAANEPTQQGNDAANQNAQQNNNATGNNTQNRPEAEQPGDSGEKPPIDTSTDGFKSKTAKDLDAMRKKAVFTVEKGSIQEDKSNAGTKIKKQQNFIGRKYGSYKKIKQNMMKNVNFKNMPEYLKELVLNNMSNFVVNTLCTAQGSKDLKSWINKNGGDASKMSYKELNEKAIEYAREKMQKMNQDLMQKHNQIKQKYANADRTKVAVDKQIFNELKQNNAGKGLVDWEAYEKAINSQGLFNPYKISSKFEVRFYRNYHIHQGIDSHDPSYTKKNLNKEDRKIIAPFDGTVVEIKRQEDKHRKLTGYGQWITLSHHPNLRSNIGHMKENSVQVKEGEKFTKGLTVIGNMGNTGSGSGPHIHHDMDYSVDSNPFGKSGKIKLDPQKFGEDLNRSGMSINDFLKSKEFIQHLKDFSKRLNSIKKKYKDNKGIYNDCKKQISLIENAIIKLKNK